MSEQTTQAAPLLSCPKCKGTGTVLHPFSLEYGPCLKCDGTGRAPEPQAPAVNWGDGMTAGHKPIVPKVYPDTAGTCESPLHRPHHEGQLHDQDDVCVNFQAASAPAPSATPIAGELYGNCENPEHVTGLSSPHRCRPDCVDFRLPQPVPDPHVLPSAPSSGGIRAHFEANMLDGQSVDDCGGAVISAKAVLEYIQEFYVIKEDAEALERERDQLRQQRKEWEAATVAHREQDRKLEQELAAARQEQATLVAGLRSLFTSAQQRLSDKRAYSGQERALLDLLEAEVSALLPVTNGESE